MASRLAIFNPPNTKRPRSNVFGADVANFQLSQALVRHGGLDQIDFLMGDPLPPEAMAAAFDATASATRITTTHLLDQPAAARAGTLLRGSPILEELSWQRRRTVGAKGYSLIGLIHTVAPLAMRQAIASASVAPIHPWDALICTSPAIQTAMVQMFDEWEDYLTDRFGGQKRPRPHLPLIPLGVNLQALSAQADRPQARAAVREAMGLGPDDVLLLWVGRLSFFEKAFPQPMMRAIEEAALRTAKRVHFVMAGWFPSPETQEPMYQAAARAYAPSVSFQIADGNDRQRLNDLWAGADIFISLVDNIQETFGITPLEAMAAGLPVVVSDWDGYRYTVREGEEGFLIPTLGGPEQAIPEAVSAGHAMGLKSYQQYTGVVAQHTAVHVGRAAAAIVSLITQPELRRRMGEAGRRRVRETFDWSVVAPQYAALGAELGAIRAASDTDHPPAPHPVKGDPFRDFAGFATQILQADTLLSLRDGAGPADLIRSAGLELDRFGEGWRLAPEDAAQLVESLSRRGPTTVKDLMLDAPPSQRKRTILTLLWMAKYGMLEWR